MNFILSEEMLPYLVTPEENRVDRYVWGLSPEIRGEFGNPKTLQDTVNLATRLTNNANRSGIFASDKVQCKKKMDEPMKRQFCGRTGKNQKVIGNFGIQTQALEKGKGTYPKFGKCNNHHSGRCIICVKFNKGGHFAKDCRSGGRRTCRECRSLELWKMHHLPQIQ